MSHDDLLKLSADELVNAVNSNDPTSAHAHLAMAMSYASSALQEAMSPVESMNAYSQMSEIHLIKGDYGAAMMYANQMHTHCPESPFGYMQKFRIRCYNRQRIFDEGPSDEPSQGIRTGLNIRAQIDMAYLGWRADSEAKKLVLAVQNHLVERPEQCVYILHYMVKTGTEYLRKAGKDQTARKICALVLASRWEEASLSDDAQATLMELYRLAQGQLRMG